MAVLVEANSVIVRCDSIHARYPGGWKQFVGEVPNQTLCSDSEIARVGFMIHDDMKLFVKSMEQHGLVCAVDGKVIDIAFADQQRGLNLPCDWLEFGHIELAEGQKVAACRLVDSSCEECMIPEGWQYEGSLSHTFAFSPSGAVDSGLTFLRHDNGLDVYFDSLAEKEVYVGRTGE